MVEAEYKFGENKTLMKKEVRQKTRSKVGTKEKRLRKGHFLED
jgi:hypothetical protein